MNFKIEAASKQIGRIPPVVKKYAIMLLSIMSVQLEISTDELLDAVVQMPKGEFDLFVRRAKQLRQNGGTEKTLSGTQADLLQKINTVFPPADRDRYAELYTKFKSDGLKETEKRELSALVEKFEKLNARRLKLLAQLAKMRGETVDMVIDQFELAVSNNV
ncbi:MAG: hypothetical protein AB7F88_07315 [Pyrinomonadaceae bacterium]